MVLRLSLSVVIAGVCYMCVEFRPSPLLKVQTYYFPMRPVRRVAGIIFYLNDPIEAHAGISSFPTFRVNSCIYT